MDVKFLEYCVSAGLLNRDVLRQVVSRRSEDVSIYDTLIRVGGISEERLAVFAGEFYKCPVVDLLKIKPESNAMRYGALAPCRRLTFFPFAVDSVAGVLIAVADYAKFNVIEEHLRSLRVERMRFYIAPYETLMHFIETHCKADGGNERSNSVDFRAHRNPSILRTQFTNLDTPWPRSAGDSSRGGTDPDKKQFFEMAVRLNELSEENMHLRQQLEKLSSALELDALMIRELAKFLKTSGLMPAAAFERWLTTQR